MSTVSRGLPANPHLDVPKKQSRELLKLCREFSTDALNRIRGQHPKFYHTENETLVKNLKLSDAQFVIAREYGFSSWAQLKERITGNIAAHLIDKAIRANDATAVTQLLL